VKAVEKAHERTGGLGNGGCGGKGGEEEVKSAESAVSREEKRDTTAASRWPFLVLTVKFIRRERSFPGRYAKNSFWQNSFWLRLEPPHVL
jgi:hypothetical protein